MLLYFSIALLTVILALQIKKVPDTTEYIRTRQQLVNKICLAAIFTILSLLIALRGGVGNDYNTYVQNAHEVYVGGYTITEPGYDAVVRAVYALCGGENYIALFALFGVMTVLIYMLAIYGQSDDFAISFMLFMTLGVYYRSFSTIRYYFVLAITLFSLRYVVKKQYIRFILLIFVAALFHKSVLIVIPIYIIANRKINKWLLAVLGAGSVVVFILRDAVLDIALRLYPTYKNTIYLTKDVGLRENIPAIVRCLAVLVLACVFYKQSIKDRPDNMLYFNLNIMAVMLYIAGSFLPLVSRFGYYMITAQILLVANILSDLRKDGYKYYKGIFAVVGMLAVLYFGYFLKTANQEGIQVLPYKTWVMTDYEWVNDEDNIIFTNRGTRSWAETESNAE